MYDLECTDTRCGYSAHLLAECGRVWRGMCSRLTPGQPGRRSQPQMSSFSMDGDHALGPLPQGLATVHWS